MKSTSTVKPDPIKIEVMNNESADILLNVNITEEKSSDSDMVFYKYDSYRVNQPNRTNLKESIESNFEKWVEFAKTKEIETLGAPILKKRNELLDQTDLVYCNAERWSSYSKEVKAKWSTYKQELRDISKQADFPYVVVWPTLPE